MNPRLIVIFGCSFCGSTYTSFVLGSLPNTDTVGESHWFLDSDVERGCSTCRMSPNKECPVYTKEVVKRLRTVPRDQFFKELFKIRQKDILISSDKNLNGIQGRATGIDVEGIVLFKNPESQFQSKKTHAAVGSNLCKPQSYDQYFNVVGNMYNGVMQYLSNRRHIFVDYDFFMTNKKNVLNYICDRMGLEYDEAALEYWNFEHHTIGGNSGAYYNIGRDNHEVKVTDFTNGGDWYRVNFRKSPEIDYRHKFVLTQEEIVGVRKHPYNNTYAHMLKSFINDFERWIKENE